MSNELTSQKESTNESSQEVTHSGRFFRPNVDILESKDELLLMADMPGTSAENVSLNYDNGNLTLHGKVEQRRSEEAQYLLEEYGVADFHREFAINEDIDAEQISADYKNGVLTVRMPKSEAVKPKHIEVKST